MKISAFLFVFLFAAILTSALVTRPTQAEPLFSGKCWLNIICIPADEDAKPGNDDASKPPASGSADEQTDPAQDGTNEGGNGGAGEGDASNPDDTQPVDNNDGAAPVVTLTANPAYPKNAALAGGEYANVVLTGTVQDDSLASYTVTLNDVVVPQYSSDTPGTNSVNISVQWNVGGEDPVPTGTYVWKLTAKDASGRTADQPAVVTIQVDNTAPDMTITGGGLIQSGSISPTVKAFDNEGNGVEGYSWTAGKDNPAPLVFDRTAAEPIFNPKVKGTYVFYLTVQDGLGNAVTKPYTFDYAPILATIPLPTIQDPTLGLNKPTGSDDAQTNVTPTIRGDQDQPSDENASVLGNTIAAAGQAAPATAASALTPTNSGWSIFGILWYWWAVVAGIMVSAWYFIKKFFDGQVAEQS